MSGGVKIISEDNISGGVLSEARRRKLSLIGGLAGSALFVVFALLGVLGTQQSGVYQTTSKAAEGFNPVILACGRCDNAGGVSYCLNRFTNIRNELAATRRYLSSQVLDLFAFNRMQREDPNTSQIERLCESCDLSPRNGSGYGDRRLNQADVDSYNAMCIPPSPTPTPIPATPTPAQPSCSRCDFNGDGLFSSDEGQQLAGCVFNQNNGGCGDRDANADGRVDAADISWCTANCQQAATPTSTPTPSTTADCRWCDFNADGVFNSDPDATQLAACAFVTGVNDCINLDINRDRILDAGDVAALNICNGAIFNSGQNPFGMACDLNRDGTIDAGDMSYGSSRLTQCIFNLGANNHCATDPNRDNQLNAADISWCSANCAPHN